MALNEVHRFFAFGTGHLDLSARECGISIPPLFGLQPVVGLTGQAAGPIYSSPRLTGPACPFYRNAASLDGSSPKRRSVVALIPLDCSPRCCTLCKEKSE